MEEEIPIIEEAAEPVPNVETPEQPIDSSPLN